MESAEVRDMQNSMEELGFNNTGTSEALMSGA